MYIQCILHTSNEFEFRIYIKNIGNLTINQYPFQGNSAGSSSDSPSLSSASFISAMSSQEDMTLINLHMQVNRPIIDSPLLMASYLSHLAQVTILAYPFSWFNNKIHLINNK